MPKQTFETFPTIQFTVAGKAQPAGSKRGFKRGDKVIVVDANAKSKQWQAIVKAAAVEAYGGPVLDGPIGIEMTFRSRRPRDHIRANGELKDWAKQQRPTSKPDALKLARGIEDALTGVIYRDDALIVVEWLEKCYADEGTPERVDVRIWRVL